jgi:hypothetical protein
MIDMGKLHRCDVEERWMDSAPDHARQLSDPPDWCGVVWGGVVRTGLGQTARAWDRVGRAAKRMW